MADYASGLRFAQPRANPPHEVVHPRDIFSNFFTSRSRFSRDNRWIQNIPSS